MILSFKKYKLLVNGKEVRKLVVALALVSISVVAWSQRSVTIDGYTVLPVIVIEGDTLPNALIPQVVVFPARKFKNDREYRQYKRLIKNIKIVYPYSQIAKNKLNEMEYQFRTLKTEKEKEAYVKKVEYEMRKEFESQLVNLTITQGRLLIKLIDREVGKTTYDVINQLKGGVSAVFWQTIARIFGSNLKSEFDTNGEDRLINELIILYENGQLY